MAVLRSYGKLTLTKREGNQYVPVAKAQAGMWWTAEVEPHVAIRLKRTFGRIGNQFGAIHIRDSDDVCRDLLWFLDRYPLDMLAEHRAWLKSEAARYDARLGAFDELLSGTLKPREFELAIPAREYQRVAADMLLRSQGLLIADDVGLGKTATAIAALTDPRTRPALVVTLTHLPKQWQNEIRKFAPGLRTHILKKGSPYDIVARMRKDRRRKNVHPGQQVMDLDPFPDVIIANYHKLSGWSETLAPHIKSVIYDECQELRRSVSLKYSAAKHLSDHVDFRCGLSATPIYNYGGEMFNVLECLRPGALGTRGEFHKEWCGFYSGYTDDKARIADPKAFGMHLREHGLMLRRTRQDVGRELPDIIRITQDVPYDTKPLDDMKGAAVELAKIIMGKAEFHEKGRAARELDWKLRQATGIAKAPHVADFVRMLVDAGEKVVLYGWHREVYSLWMQRLDGCHPVMYTGSESTVQKEKAVDAFVNGDARVLIISLRSGAGLDGLQLSTRNVVFGELDWSPGVHEQCEGRVNRDGQQDAVAAYYMIADGGSDPVVADVLGVKDAQIRGVVDPNASVIEKQSNNDRIKDLARRYLDNA